MKYLLVLLALMPLALGAEFQEIAAANDRSLSSQVVDFLEALKVQMPCGFPGMGLPPMAPLKAGHREININSGGIKAYGEVNNFRLDGLNDFDIVDFKISAILSKVTFKFNWNHVHLNTDYELSTSLDNFRMKRSGNAKFALKNLTVWGVVKYSLGVISGNLRLKEVSVYMSLDEVNSDIEGLSKIKIINKKLNQIIEEWIMLAINDNTDNMADLTNSIVVPLANNLIGDMGLSDIIGMVVGGGGGGGNEGGEPVEKIPCIPPEDN